MFVDDLELLEINHKNRLYGWANKNGKALEFETLEEKIEVLDIKYEELDDEIGILQDNHLKDIKTIDDKVKKLEDIGKDNVKIQPLNRNANRGF